MDIIQNIYSNLLLEKQEKERVLEQTINNPKNYYTQLSDATTLLKELGTLVTTITLLEAYLSQQPPAKQEELSQEPTNTYQTQQVQQ